MRRRAGGLDALLDRDGYRCGICSEVLDPALRVPDVMALTIDHIVPVSQGGTDDLSNLRFAHNGCNARKRAAA